MQKDLQQQSEIVQDMLNSASTGAAKVVARKLLDTLKREAVAFEDAQKSHPGPAPSPSAEVMEEGQPSNSTSDVTATAI